MALVFALFMGAQCTREDMAPSFAAAKNESIAHAAPSQVQGLHQATCMLGRVKATLIGCSLFRLFYQHLVPITVHSNSAVGPVPHPEGGSTAPVPGYSGRKTLTSDGDDPLCLAQVFVQWLCCWLGK